MRTPPRAGDIVRVTDPAAQYWAAEGIFDPAGGQHGQVVMGTGMLRIHDGWTVNVIDPVPKRAEDAR